MVPLPDDAMDQLRLQALVIGTRALAVQFGRPPSPCRDWLAGRICALTGMERR